MTRLSLASENSIDFNFFRVVQLKSKAIRYFLTIIFLVFVFHGFGTVYYVSSSGGNDANSGTSPDKAWKTLTRVNSFTPKAGDQILFNRGDEWEGTITVNSSGTSGSPIVYGAYGTGVKPKIYGSQVVSGWTLHIGNIYKATFSSDVQQLFVNEKRMLAARYPNEKAGFPSDGYYFISSVGSSTTFTSKNLDLSLDYTGAKWFGRTNYWMTELRDVTSSSSQTLTLNSAPTASLNVNEGFFLMNKLEFLTQAGEWYYDSATNILYLWTPGGDTPANYTVRASTTDFGLTASSKSYISVENLEFLHQSVSGINYSGGSYMKINNNVITYPDTYGIHEGTGTSYNTITNNTVVGANNTGILVRASYSTVQDNVVEDTGLFENIGLSGGHGEAIKISGVNGNNKIKYNRITNAGYNGIYFLRENNIIEYNFISNTLLLKSDGGGIYTSYNTKPGTHGSVVKHNIVLNSKGEKYGFTGSRNLGEGIYMDESAADVSVENNTVAYSSNSGIKIHKNENTTVRNNTIFDARQSIHVLSSSGTVKNKVTNNLMITASGEDDYLERQVFINTSSGNATFDYNTYINPFTNERVFTSAWNAYNNLSEWQSYIKSDKNSNFMEPNWKPEKSRNCFTTIPNKRKHSTLVPLFTGISMVIRLQENLISNHLPPEF
jgi:parallel beta-helix repeat protein